MCNLRTLLGKDKLTSSDAVDPSSFSLKYIEKLLFILIELNNQL